MPSSTSCSSEATLPFPMLELRKAVALPPAAAWQLQTDLLTPARCMLPSMPDTISIRRAIASERGALEALQRRASLANLGDRDARLAQPEAIDITLCRLESGHVYAAERGNAIVGFAAIQPLED